MGNFGGIFDLASVEKELGEIEEELARPDSWEDRARTNVLMKKKSLLTSRLESIKAIASLLEESELLLELAEEAEDTDSVREADEKLTEAREAIRGEEVKRMLGGENDARNAIVSIHPGAGGTEAMDWAGILLRMYTRWVEGRGFKMEVLDYQPGEEAGVKSVTFTVSGEFAYGYLKAESGVHRLVRISPFDAGARRHTSFASVLVYPDIAEDIDIEILDSDIRVDTFRASGAGGQHVNKTDSAIRITHIPTGIVTQCQSQRSQHKNKATALKVLKARLYEKKRAEDAEKMESFQKEKREIAWGSQIRSYVLQPYQLVKDHRTGIDVGNVERVLDGDIDGFIEGFLFLSAGERKGA
ncbi:MAG: peptide chain release factor 2 [Thermodesulfobacteriota bacterium]